MRPTITRRLLGAATAIALGTMLFIQPASAGVGGGAVGGGGGSGSGAVDMLLATQDDALAAAQGNPVQGWGQSSIDYFAAAIRNSGIYPMTTSSSGGTVEDRANAACGQAIADAVASTPGATTARVVQFGIAVGPQVGNEPYYTIIGSSLSEFLGWYAAYSPAGSNYLLNYDAPTRQAVHDVFVAKATAIGTNVRAVCVALNNLQTGTNTYDLSVTSDRGATFSSAGTTTSVDDVIHASNGGAGVVENLSANVVLNWQGPAGATASHTKTGTITNNGDTRSPGFTPSDFGWTSWPAGTFWFDIQVPKQARMNAAIDTPDQDPRETWTATGVDPAKTINSAGTSTPIADGAALVAGQSYDARVVAHSDGYSQMTISDIIDTDKVWIGASSSDTSGAVKVVDATGATVSSTIAIDRGTTGKVTVTAALATVPAQGYYTLVVPTYLQPTSTDYTLPDDSQACYNSGATCRSGNSKLVRKVTPAPDKAWVLDTAGALVTADPTGSNDVGVDNKVFLPGETISAVVNGSIPTGLGEPMSRYLISDDWTAAAAYVDFSDATKVSVYFNGTDVTDEFTIVTSGSKTVATAKPAFLARTMSLEIVGSVKLVLNGSFRTDYSTSGATVSLTNSGSETWGSQNVATNTPAVFTWTPTPTKDVLGAVSQGGDESSINGMSVWPGQSVEYQVGIDLRIPGNLETPITSLAVQDTYDPNLTPTQSTVSFVDTRTAKTIPRSAYTLTWNTAGHSFTATFSNAWVSANVSAAAQGWLVLKFTGVVNDTVPGGATVSNQAFEILNGTRFATNTPTVTIPLVTPHKAALSTTLADINGKTLVDGDHVLYRLTLDASTPAGSLAYAVHKLGITDTYDQAHLQLTAAGVSVVDASTGTDVSDRFNIQVSGGVAYVFAKQVDSTNVDGVAIAGNPQPSNLAAYAASKIDALTTPVIDASLMGHTYQVILDTTVHNAATGVIVTNQAWQNTENSSVATEIVSNPLAAISPSKDVVVSESDQTSLNGTEVPLGTSFNYKLTTSQIPTDRAYDSSSWSLSDAFDTSHDQATGVWAIYADTDVYNGATLVFAKGSLIADSAGHQSALLDGMFDVTTAPAFTVTATAKYRALVNSRSDLAQGWAVYVQMNRVAPGNPIVNTYHELYNGVDRASNQVSTTTTEHPAISVVKFTYSDGPTTGVHRTQDSRQLLTDAEAAAQSDPKAGLRIGFKVTNTGDVPLTGVTLNDQTVAGSGAVGEISCRVLVPEQVKAALNAGSKATAPDTQLVAMSTLRDLAAGESVTCYADMTGLKLGDSHHDTVTATGKSVFTGTEVNATDDWYAYALRPEIQVSKYTLSEGPKAGAHDTADDAMPLTSTQVAAGVQVGIIVTNSGDVDLTDVTLSDATIAGTGTVDAITCTVPNAAGDTSATVTDGKLGSLAVGHSVSCQGTLHGLAAGSSHTDTATVTAVAASVNQTPVKASNDWNATLTIRKTAQTGGVIMSRNPALAALGLVLVLGGVGVITTIRRRPRNS